MTGATYPNGEPVPAWAGSVSRLHGLGLLSVEKYQHPRVAVTPAFCRRMRNVERRARGYGLDALADRASTLRGGAARFGFRGATDTWMNATPYYMARHFDDCLRDSGPTERRRIVFLVGLIRRAFADLAAGRTGA